MLSTESPPTLSSEDQEQILQTLEMFEVITQANPQDCQSMDILKDAYQRVGKPKEALSVARRLGDTYVELGQFPRRRCWSTKASCKRNRTMRK